MFDRLKKFFLDARTEIRHVNWPTQQEAIRLTSIVIGISVGIAVFLGLIAYDTQKLKALHAMSFENSEMQNKVAILGALTLYLDFINLFLLLLRIFGKRRD